MPKRRTHGQGGLYYVETRGLWRATVELGDDPVTGKRRTKVVTARTQRAARDKMTTIQKEIAKHGAPLDRQVRLEEWAGRWLDVRAREVDPKTWTGYRGAIRNWIAPTLGRKLVSSLKPSDVHALHERIADAGKAVSTARQAHIVLSMMLDAAKAEGLCQENVAEHVRKPGARGRGVAAKTRDALTTDHVLAILRAAYDLPDHAGSRWWLKLLGGPRQTEILGARISDLDLDARLYEVWWKLEALARGHGCGDSPCGWKMAAKCPQKRWRVAPGFELEEIEHQWCWTRPKSRPGRAIPLLPQLAAEIGRHLDATSHLPNPHGLIWRNADGSPITPVQDNAEWRSLLVAAGVIEPGDAVPGGTEWTGHTARHTTVTVLAELGVDFQMIGEIVGHSSAQVTAIYRHARDEERRAVMQRLGDVWADALPALTSA